MQTADVVVPVKNLLLAKSRLSTLLGPKERIGLVEAMLRDVLSALSRARLVETTSVITPDRTLGRLFESPNIHILNDPPGASLNEAIDAVTHRSSKTKPGTALLVIPVDVPLVKSSTIDSMISESQNHNGPCVVAVESRDQGTNALLRRPPDSIKTRFGPGSFGVHMAEAARNGVEFVRFRSADLELDIDTSYDLLALWKTQTHCATMDFLRKTKLFT
jgi:2-phospho-L-lactate guanylyltransferase